MPTFDDYHVQADWLFQGLRSGSDDARWRFKWEHPKYRGRPVDAVDPATLTLADAQLVIARQDGFLGWPELIAFMQAVALDPGVARFEAAVDAVVTGDLPTLRALLDEHPELVRERSARRHRATLLHYVAANGVEGRRQTTPANAVEIATLLLESGAEPDALADMYEAECTTMSMLVSSSPPSAAGLQAALAETVLDHGAALVGLGSNWQSAVMTALAFGFRETAEMLAKRGAPIDLAAAAGLGRVADVNRLLPGALATSRHAALALALAAQHGHVEVLRLLLDAGEDPNRFNPDGHHPHSTPLHQAVWGSHLDAVRFLVERGASVDIRDTLFRGTPLDWAVYGKRDEIAEYLRGLEPLDGAGKRL